MGQKDDEEKLEAFAAYEVFESHSREITIEEKNMLLSDINIPAKMVVLARPFTVKEMLQSEH